MITTDIDILEILSPYSGCLSRSLRLRLVLSFSMVLTAVSGFIVGDNFHNGNIRPPILLPEVIEQSRKDSTLGKRFNATLGRIKSAKSL